MPNVGEVLVKIKTSGVNPSDVKIRAGARGELQFPRVIPHSDGGGEIVGVGEGVDRNRIGERVWIWNGAFGRADGTCAELISLPEFQAVKINNEVSYESAACMGIPASTAYYGLLANGPIKNKTVLISGGAGAVGFYGIQIAKLSGANVITTISNDEKAEIANNAGADKIINYKKENVLKEIMEYTENDGVDRIFEVEFGGNLPINEKIIKPNGVIAAYGSMAEMEPKLPFYNLMFKGVKIDTFLIYSIIVSSLAAPVEFSPLMTILFFPSLSITLLAWKLFPKNWKVFNLIPLRINDTLLLCFTFNIVAEILI